MCKIGSESAFVRGDAAGTGGEGGLEGMLP